MIKLHNQVVTLMAFKSDSSVDLKCCITSSFACLLHWLMLWGTWKCVFCILLQPTWSLMLSSWETQYPVLCWYHLVVHHEGCCTSYESSAKGGGVWCHSLAVANRRPRMPPCGGTKKAIECISWMNDRMTTILPLSWLYIDSTAWCITVFLQNQLVFQ